MKKMNFLSKSIQGMKTKQIHLKSFLEHISYTTVPGTCQAFNKRSYYKKNTK